MDAEAIEILKNPHKYREFLTKDFLSGCGFVNCDITCDGVILVHREDRYAVYINLSRNYIDCDGLFDLCANSFDKDVASLENYFEYPLLPTKEEREMFYIEHGFEYPIKTVDI